jgi:hypothetical protein
MSDKALSNLTQGSSDTGEFIYGVVDSSSRKIQIGTLPFQTETDADVVGPASATDNAIARYDGATGKLIQGSGVIIDDSDNISGAASLTLSGANGVDVNPGSDIDADLLTVGVTGAPTFSWDESADAFKYSKPVIISSDGNGDITHTIAGASVVSDLEVHSEGTADLGGIVVHRHTDTNDFGGHLLFLRSDGTHASPTLVDDGDTLGRIIGLGQDGTDYELGAEIRFVVDGVAANNVMYGAVDIYTNNGGQTLTRRARFRADGSVEIVTGPLTLPNTGLHLLDTNASHDLIIAPGSDLTADRTLTLTTGDADRTLSLPSPTFVNTTLSGYLEGAEISTPSNPAANSLRVYPVDDGGTTKLATLDSAGTETILGSGGGGGGSQDFQRFNASGTWTKPTDAEFGTNSIVLIRAWGAGGSGASASTSSGGGGGGYVSRQMLLSELGSTETVTIGAGGASVSSGTGTGNDGGNTTFGSHVTAYLGAGAVVNPTGGGGGGPLGAASGITPGSPLIVTNTTGPIRLGQGGTSGVAGTAGIDHGGGGGSGAVGGASVNGGGGGGGNNASTAFAGGVSINGGNGGAGGVDGANGTAGTQPGGGGGSAETGGASGAGADGRVDVIVFPVA